MNIFETIMQKIGLNKPKPANLPQGHVVQGPPKPTTISSGHSSGGLAVTPPSPTQEQTADGDASSTGFSREPAPAPMEAEVADTGFSREPRPEVISVVDVMSKLESLSAERPGLNWKVSIVDLLKLLEMDSSLSARKKLAKELDCPANTMSDSARMNVWLHKTVLQKIAENGGNLPDDLLS